jgi:tRNA 2-thiouridine synthesizing protein B|tara:strand:+ start:588 stop:905 length:318 start_codon:yes stop_codon:yes gene_type:complete
MDRSLTMLHILRHTPQDTSRFASSLRVMGPKQGLLLIEDGVYALLPRTTALSALQLLPASVRLYALETDVIARGLAMDDVPKRVTLVDYPTFVQLCTQYDKVLSW